MKFIPSLGEFSTKGKAAFQRFKIILSCNYWQTIYVVSKERMTLSKEFEKLKVKFVFTNLSFTNTNTLQNINTYVLIKEK